MIVLIALLAASAAPSPAILDAGQRTTFAIDLDNPRPNLARVAEAGSIYLADADSTRVVAYARQGNLLWEAQVATELAERNLRALDVAVGKVFVLESSTGQVYVLDAARGTVLETRAMPGGVPPPGGLAADGRGGFYVAREDGSIDHYLADGRRDNFTEQTTLGCGRDVAAVRSGALDGSLFRSGDGTGRSCGVVRGRSHFSSSRPSGRL